MGKEATHAKVFKCIAHVFVSKKGGLNGNNIPGEVYLLIISIIVIIRRFIFLENENPWNVEEDKFWPSLESSCFWVSIL